MPNNLNQLVTEFLTSLEQHTAQTTVRNYKYYLERFIKWSQLNKPQDITENKIDNFKDYLSGIRNSRGELMKSTTQNYHLIALRAFLNFLKQQDVPSISAAQVILNKTPHKKSATLPKSDLERLLEAPLQIKNAGIIQKRDKAILELLFNTGLKVSEVASLKKNHINFFDTKLTIRNAKDKPRTVLLADQAKYWLKQYLDNRTDSLAALFIRHDKAKQKQLQRIRDETYQLTPRTIQRIVKKYTKSCGLSEHITPETLRQLHAAHLASQGYDIQSIQSMLGHASIATTKFYIKK